MSDTDKIFTGSIPKLYETYLVPLIFEPYAADLANRLASRSLTRVLEIAAGTGVVTRALASVLPERASIVATDLNQSMLDQASALGTKRPVEWRQADGMRLPFQDGTFDAVVCQFGVMFFPEKSKAFSEARRLASSLAHPTAITTVRPSSEILQTEGSKRQPKWPRLRRAVGRNRRGSQPSRTARGHHYETRSRSATPRGSAKP